MDVGPLSKMLNTKLDQDDTSRTQGWKTLFEAGKLAQSEGKLEHADALYKRAHAVLSKKSGDMGLVAAEILMQQGLLKEAMGDPAGARETAVQGPGGYRKICKDA